MLIPESELNLLSTLTKAMGYFSFLYIRLLFLIRNFVDMATGIFFNYRCEKRLFLPPIQNPLLLMPAHQLADQIRRKQIKSEDLVRAYIKRIMEVNSTLNAVVGQCFESALVEARAVDRYVASGEKNEEEMAQEKPLLGVPFTAKEHISVKGLPPTIGLQARKNLLSEKDAAAIQLMKNAGAIVIAVTNTPELCLDWADCSNPVFGKTLNAYNTQRVPGGSSGGEGSILGAAGSVIGIGSDLSGSIRFPSMFNGIFGHKPSQGLISSEGALPLIQGTLKEYFTLGPMCRYASDLRPVLKVLLGENARVLRLDDKVSLKNIKFYYMEDLGGCPIVSPVNKEIKQAHQKAINYLQKSHGIHVKKVHIPTIKYSMYILLNGLWSRTNFKLDEAATNFQGSLNMFMEFTKWLLKLSNRSLSFLVVTLLTKSIPKPSGKINELVKRKRQKLQEELQILLGHDGVLLYPTHPTTAVYHSQGLLQMFNFIYSGIFNVYGMPATHCTLGMSKEGLPLGIQVVSNVNNDRLCLAVAEELEKGFGGWISPPSGMPSPINNLNGFKV